MKYVRTLLFIVTVITAVTVYYLWPEPEITEGNVLVIVNGHTIPRTVLKQRKAEGRYHNKTESEIIDAVIINDLLLQEAQRLNMDKEPGFRRAVENYYEQSLIKILIDRRMNAIQGSATDEEVDRFIGNYGKIFTFTKLSDDEISSVDQGGESRSLLFDDLSDSLKILLSDMDLGDVRTKFNTSNGVISFRLDKIEAAKAPPQFDGNRERVKKIISNYKREQSLTAWIEKLRDQATIKIPTENGIAEKP